MRKVDSNYKRVVHSVKENGYKYRTKNRKNEEFTQLDECRFPVELQDEGLPILSLKRVSFKNVITELLWFLKGDDNVSYMDYNGCKIWNKDAYNYYLKKCNISGFKKLSYKDFLKEMRNPGSIPYDKPENYEIGDTGEQYPKLWRHWDHLSVDDYGIDQIHNLIEGLRNNPYSRRHVVTAWNPATLDDMALPACHIGFRCIIRPLNIFQRMAFSEEDQGHLKSLTDAYLKDDDKEAKERIDKIIFNIPDKAVSLHFTQRSADVFLGMPYNILSYSILNCIIGYLTDMIPLNIVGKFENVHLYSSHDEAVKELQKRVGIDQKVKLQVTDEGRSIMDRYKEGHITTDDLFRSLEPEHFFIQHYKHEGEIKATMIPEDKN